MKQDLNFLPRTNGYDHLPLVPGIEITDPRTRSALLLREWENEDPASTGPLPHGCSVYHSAQKCADPANQPIGLAWVAALTRAVVLAHNEARCVPSPESHATGS